MADDTWQGVHVCYDVHCIWLRRRTAKWRSCCSCWRIVFKRGPAGDSWTCSDSDHVTFPLVNLLVLLRHVKTCLVDLTQLFIYLVGFPERTSRSRPKNLTGCRQRWWSAHFSIRRNSWSVLVFASVCSFSCWWFTGFGRCSCMHCCGSVEPNQTRRWLWRNWNDDQKSWLHRTHW